MLPYECIEEIHYTIAKFSDFYPLNMEFEIPHSKRYCSSEENSISTSLSLAHQVQKAFRDNIRGQK